MNVFTRVSVFLSVLMLSGVAQAQTRRFGVPTIFTAKRDGAEPKELIRIPGMQWHGGPSWSPDGKQVVFDASPNWRGGDQSHIFVCTVDGNNLRDLGNGSAPRWSPDGQSIAFQLRVNPAAGDPTGVCLMAIDGTGMRRLCDGERPRWSPDGKQLVFVRKTPESIHLLNVKTMKEQRVLDEKFSKVTGAGFSPDGKRIAFIGYRQRFPQGELGILTQNGAKWTFRVRHRGRMGWQPSWSPDGKQLVIYTVNGQSARRLHTISSDGPDAPVQMKNQDDAVYNTDANWSPDGKRLIFSRARK